MLSSMWASSQGWESDEQGAKAWTFLLTERYEVHVFFSIGDTKSVSSVKCPGFVFFCEITSYLLNEYMGFPPDTTIRRFFLVINHSNCAGNYFVYFSFSKLEFSMFEL